MAALVAVAAFVGIVPYVALQHAWHGRRRNSTVGSTLPRRPTSRRSPGQVRNPNDQIEVTDHVYTLTLQRFRRSTVRLKSGLLG